MLYLYSAVKQKDSRMQFKEVGNRIQILRYEGYDKEKRHAKVKMVGSLNKYRPKYDSRLDDVLTSDEKEEVQSYIKEWDSKSAINSANVTLMCAHDRVAMIADSLTHEGANLNEFKPDLVWSELDRLQKIMRKLGYKKPKAAKAKPADPRQGKLM